MPPEVRNEVVKVAGQPDVTTTVREYDPFKLITAALIVGTGGASFITAMRDRLLKTVNQANLHTLSQAVVAQGDQIGANIATARSDGTEAISHDELVGRMSALSTFARIAGSNTKP